MRKFGSRWRRGGRAAAGRLPAPAPPARLLPGSPPTLRDLPATGGAGGGGGRNEPLAAAASPPPSPSPARSCGGCRGTPTEGKGGVFTNAPHRGGLEAAPRGDSRSSDSPPTPGGPHPLFPPPPSRLSQPPAPSPRRGPLCSSPSPKQRGKAPWPPSRRWDGCHGPLPKAPAPSLPFTNAAHRTLTRYPDHRSAPVIYFTF